jgi:hypothetical protein
MIFGLLADFSTSESRGKISGLVGLFSCTGAIVALFGFLNMASIYGLANVYRIEGIIAFVFGVLVYLILSKPKFFQSFHCVQKKDKYSDTTANEATNNYNDTPNASTDPSQSVSDLENAQSPSNNSPVDSQTELLHTQEPNEHPKKLVTIIKDGFYAAKDLNIALGYISSLLARGDSIIITLFIPL